MLPKDRVILLYFRGRKVRFTLKKAWKRWESVKARGRRAKKVLKPPCNTAGPMSSMAL